MSDAPDHQPPVAPLGEDVYRLICEHAGIALVVTDTEGKIRLWNRRAARVFGAAASQMLGAPILSILPAQERAEAEHLLRGAITDHEVNEFEFSQRDRAGRRRHFAASIAPVVDQSNTMLGASIWVRDVTRRTELFREVAQGRKMVALGEMAGAVAHYFNNILGGMVTGVDFALAAGDPEIEHRVLIQTSQSLARAAHLIENLLAFAEGDRRSPDLADLTEVVLAALDTVESELARAGIKLELNLQPVPIREVPRRQMTTAILNLVRNAVEAMPNGGKLRIGLEAGNGGCLLSLRDTGCGVAEENLDRVFEPFYSTKTALADTEDRAAGLGLAVVHGIIHEIGGKISVSSVVGEGTLFEIRIPDSQEAPVGDGGAL